MALFNVILKRSQPGKNETPVAVAAAKIMTKAVSIFSPPFFYSLEEQNMCQQMEILYLLDIVCIICRRSCWQERNGKIDYWNGNNSYWRF
jgi:hypothetical protein